MDAGDDDAVALLVQKCGNKALPATLLMERVEPFDCNASHAGCEPSIEVLERKLRFLRVYFELSRALIERADGSLECFSVAALREARKTSREKPHTHKEREREERKRRCHGLGLERTECGSEILQYEFHTQSIPRFKARRVLMARMFRKRIYMDFAAATPIHPSVLREMKRGFSAYGNPLAAHHEARSARALLNEARERVARALSVKPEQVYFTGSGTESNNLAEHGVIEALLLKGAKPESLHMIVSDFEHASSTNVARYWERHGVSVSYAKPNTEGIVHPEEVVKLVRPETVLVSIVAVQSEIGQIQPLRDISRALERIRIRREQTVQELSPEARFPILHTDASQSPLFVDLSPHRLGVDLATYDAQKIMGPKGVGVLYRNSAVPLSPIMHGGPQERGLRPGTENVSSALGIAKALELAGEGREERARRVAKVRDYLIALIQKEVPQAELNGSIKHRIANNVSISLPGMSGDYLAVLMDRFGVAVSTRSACTSRDGESNAVRALGKKSSEARGTLRFTLTPWATRVDARRAVDALKKSIAVIDQVE